MEADRRTLLGMITGVPLLFGGPPAARAQPTTAEDRYGSNTELYADPNLVEGVDYARRYRRHAIRDDSEPDAGPVPKTVVIAAHGGGIEGGTSELCLGIAGYHPASLEPWPAAGPVHDYWMFEGVRDDDNGELHVTSTHCDDPVALSWCGGALNAVSLHGCTPAAIDEPPGSEAVLVGGAADQPNPMKRSLLERLRAAGFDARDAAGYPELGGRSAQNIVNRTLLRMGGQLELSTPLRRSMFGTYSSSRRKHTTTAVFWRFTAAVREAIMAVEAGQPG
ncbi:poly-gamma-glutamate hydrolase family protein [Amycolatopsis cihanbeyliensis]|uniref:poly-gamma-glutamate hydrolase family protein n=1 Tax=Amycolatopsis cihanbeyliensis TaxID=1128664 RepID=UPI001FE7AF48|nr:poly-gamma-glutamate hydrolase family protein [Amycolatopsis cihanbeyliensis]